MNKYVYPAIFTPEGQGYTVRFPDLECCYTEGDSLAEAVEMARDVLCHSLYNLETQHKPIPLPTDLSAIAVPEGSFVSLVDADTMEYRRFYESRSVKKTLTIPSWLNSLAEEQHVNFSGLLQEALRQHLGV